MADERVAPLLERAFMFVEDGEWQRADEHCEKALDIDPHNAGAYLCKLLVKTGTKRLEDLGKTEVVFESFPEYKRLMEFADDDLKNSLELCVSQIKKRKAEERIKARYSFAVSAMASARTETEYFEAAAKFKGISDYSDSAELAEICLKNAEAAKEKSETKKQKKLEQKAKTKKIVLISSLAAVLVAVITVVLTFVVMPEIKYNKSLKNAAEGRFEESIEIMADLDGYKDSEEQIEKIKYAWAVDCRTKGQYEEAIKLFEKLGDYGDSVNQVLYTQALQYESNGDIAKAAIYFGKAGECLDSRERSFALWDKIAKRDAFSIKNGVFVGLKSDGTVLVNNTDLYGNLNSVYEWTDITAVSAGSYYVAGLKSDGTVVKTRRDDDDMQNVENWADIVAISAGYTHTAGLKSDGTVVQTGGPSDVSDWEDIVAISAGYRTTAGLKSDGTVVATSFNDKGQCDVSNWKDIVEISAGYFHTAGLKSDGTVVATGSSYPYALAVDNWEDIVAVSAGTYHTVGLKSDGTVVSTPVSNYSGGKFDYDDGQDEVGEWTDIVAIYAGNNYTLAIKSDGTVVEAGFMHIYSDELEVIQNTNFQFDKIS